MNIEGKIYKNLSSLDEIKKELNPELTTLIMLESELYLAMVFSDSSAKMTGIYAATDKLIDSYIDTGALKLLSHGEHLKIVMMDSQLLDYIIWKSVFFNQNNGVSLNEDFFLAVTDKLCSNAPTKKDTTFIKS